MNGRMEDEMFMRGVKAGVCLYQNVVIKAHERKDALMIGDELYYLQSGRERLQDVIEKICK